MTAAILAVNLAAFGQANFWNLNGSYMDCNTGGTGTLSSTSYPLYLYQADASSFAIPGLCETYCKLDYTPHGGRVVTYKIDHITEGFTTPPSIPGFSLGSYSLGFGYTVYSDASSIAATKLKADRTRDVYAYTTGQILKIATISPVGAVSLSPTVLYTLPGAWTPSFDRWTAMEVSSDGENILLGGTDALTLEVYNIASGTLTSYPAPGGGSFRIQGFEYVSMGSFLAPRLYVSYNNRSASNPTGTGGVAYYNLGNTSTYTSVTTSVGFGFSEIELAKNGLLYLGYAGSSPAYNFTGTGTVYSLTTGGTLSATAFTVPASNNVNYSALCNKYYIQTQIDGEDYDAGSYITPSVIPVSVYLSSVIGFTGPSPSTPTIYTCNPELLPLNFSVSGLINEYEIIVRRGTISGSTFIVDGSYFPVGVVQTNYFSNTVSGLTIPALALWNECDWEIEIKVKGACANSSTHKVYYRVRKPIVTAYNTKIKSITGTLTPSYSSTPLLYRCGDEPLVLTFNTTGTLSGYDVKVTKGSISTGDVFTPAGGADNYTFTESGSIFATTVTLMPASFVPTSFVGSDWKIEVTPKTPCGLGGTSVSYFKTQNATIIANYHAYRYINTAVGIGDNNKPLQTTPAITSSMPSGASISAFKDALNAAIGWQGASTAGITGISTSGDWEFRSYEADVTTGERKAYSGVPVADYAYKSGSSSTTGDFDIAGSSKGFDDSQPNYIDESTNFVDGLEYLREYYTWAYGEGPSELAAFSAKVWCAEFSVTTLTGCTVVNKSYFRIANNGLLNGRTAKTTDNQLEPIEEEFAAIRLFPNPASKSIIIELPYSNEPSEILLMDNSGRKIFKNNDLHSGKNELNIENLPSGIYFYEININNSIKHGKLVKQ